MARTKNAKRRPALRIVSLSPSCTSILCAIGAERNLAGVTKWCKDVAPVKRLPAFGDCWRLESLEQIARLRPTLIVGSVPFHPQTVAKILTLPTQFLALNPGSLADIYSDIETLARLTNRAANGRKLIADMKERFSQIRRASPKKSQPIRVYAEAWPNPRISSPPWVSELIALCGAAMVPAAGARVSDEEVAAASPDVIVLAWAATGTRANARKTLANPKWQSLPAVRNRRVFIIRDELLNTPGPTLMDGAGEISHIINGTSGDSA
jgi:iron complex transport system substrate-binding protein